MNIWLYIAGRLDMCLCKFWSILHNHNLWLVDLVGQVHNAGIVFAANNNIIQLLMKLIHQSALRVLIFV